jgi:hypothetical protein
VNPLWLLLAAVVLGAAALLALAMTRRRLSTPPAATAPPPPTADDIRRELADLLGDMVGRASPDVMAAYESIHRRMLMMLPRIGRLDGTSQDLHILHRTAGDYLPTAVRSYLSVVRAGAADRPLPDGRTPRQAVLEQLRLIDARLADIDDALNRNDVDRLLAHGRFLEVRFGTDADDLRLPPSEPGSTGS